MVTSWGMQESGAGAVLRGARAGGGDTGKAPSPADDETGAQGRHEARPVQRGKNGGRREKRAAKPRECGATTGAARPPFLPLCTGLASWRPCSPVSSSAGEGAFPVSPPPAHAPLARTVALLMAVPLVALSPVSVAAYLVAAPSSALSLRRRPPPCGCCPPPCLRLPERPPCVPVPPSLSSASPPFRPRSLAAARPTRRTPSLGPGRQYCP